MRLLWTALWIVSISTPQDKKDSKPCDLSTLEKAKVCNEKCAMVDPPLDKSGCCPCGVNRFEEREVCVRVYYQCPKKKHRGERATYCDCGRNWTEKVISRAAIVWRCEATDCTYVTQNYPGMNCQREGCSRSGKPLSKSCAASGQWPHGGEKP